MMAGRWKGYCPATGEIINLDTGQRRKWPYEAWQRGEEPEPQIEMIKAKEAPMNEAQIRHMVDRFLSWKLPVPFQPDGYISFEAERATRNASWPVGTNLFTATQAEAMVRNMIDGIPGGIGAEVQLLHGVSSAAPDAAEAAGALKAFAAVYVGVYQTYAQYGSGADAAMGEAAKAVANFAAAMHPILEPGAEADRG